LTKKTSFFFPKLAFLMMKGAGFVAFIWRFLLKKVAVFFKITAKKTLSPHLTPLTTSQSGYNIRVFG
jgi:hypothetical protein